MRTIQHPSVEINEIDISQVAPAIAGTKCLLTGFSDRGEENQPYEFTSRNAFLNYFGEPTNEAEYYFYYAANEIIQQNGGLVAARLPYNSNSTGKFNTRTYSVATESGFTDPLSSLESEGVSGFAEISPTGPDTSSVILASQSSIDGYRTGTLPTAQTIVVVNKLRDSLKKTSLGNEESGIFTAFVTPFNAFSNQNLVEFESTSDPYTDWNCISDIKSASGASITLSGLYSTPLVQDFTKKSLAKTLGALYPAITYDSIGKIDNYYLHQVMIVVCRTYEDVNNDNKLGVQIIESFIGSLNKASVDSATGESIFLDDIVNNNSDYIELYSNVTNLPSVGYMYKYSDVSNLLGFKEVDTTKNIQVSSINSGLNIIFDKTSNIDDTQIDIVVDAGISTISNYVTGGIYDPTVFNTSSDTITSRDFVDNWRTISNEFIGFCKDIRKDCIAVIDGPRNLVLQGNEKIERPSAPSQLIDIAVMPKLKYISGLNSSYGTGNIMWQKVINEFTGKAIWVPPSCKTAGIMVYTDRVANYWDAPAGLNRGILYGVSDIAFNPKPGQMDQIYTKAWNYVRNYPLDGIVLEGQKTLQVKPSAFDRVNVRRLFLRLERTAYNVLKYYMYEPNNYFTRTQIIDTLTPVFEDVKIRGGLYDYRIVCSEKNNTPDVIDRNELKIAIMLKPTRTAEFILVDFYALRTGASFNEVIL